MTDFIDRNIDSPLDLLTPDLARPVAIGGFRKLAPKVDQYLKDPRTPASSRSRPCMDCRHTTRWRSAPSSPTHGLCRRVFPQGGMRRTGSDMRPRRSTAWVPLRHHGGEVGAHSNGRASGIVTDSGEVIAADAVILNPDLPVAYRDLLGEEPGP